MNPIPPRMASWLLRRLGPHRFAESLAGDLCEDFRRRPSALRYWREVAHAVCGAQAQRAKDGALPILKGLLASWAILATCLCGADSLEQRWMYRCPGCFYPRIQALTAATGPIQWTGFAQWAQWLMLVGCAHVVAGAMLAVVPRRYRIAALLVLLVSLLDWKLPIIGGLMRHVLDSRPEEGVHGNLVELGIAMLGVIVGMRAGCRLIDALPREPRQARRHPQR